MREQEAIDFLERRLKVQEPLSARELADFLCDLRAVNFLPTRETLAHRFYADLPPCPAFISTKQQPEGPLSREILLLLGSHMALAFVSYAKEKNLVVAGVPETGKVLAKGFQDTWKKLFGQVRTLNLERNPEEMGYILDPNRRAGIKTEYAVIIDNASITGSSISWAAHALRKKRYSNIDVFVLVDRGEGASEMLAKEGSKLIAQVALRTVISQAERKGHANACIWPKLQQFQNAVREKNGLGPIALGRV